MIFLLLQEVYNLKPHNPGQRTMVTSSSGTQNRISTYTVVPAVASIPSITMSVFAIRAISDTPITSFKSAKENMPLQKNLWATYGLLRRKSTNHRKIRRKQPSSDLSMTKIHTFILGKNSLGRGPNWGRRGAIALCGPGLFCQVKNSRIFTHKSFRRATFFLIPP